MKKPFIILTLALTFLLSGCKTTYLVISKESLDREINNIDIELEEKGYIHSSSRQEGDDYIFFYSDSLGNTIEYTLFYKLDIEEHDGLYYVTDLEVKECNSSKPRECNKNSSIRNIEELYPDTSIRVYSPEKTRLLGVCGGIGVLGLGLILLLCI